MSNLSKYKKDINKLVRQGETLLKKLKNENDLINQRQEYEIWYSEALSIIAIILPNRSEDIKKMYYDEKIRDGLRNLFQYTPPVNEGFPSIGTYLPPKKVDSAKSIFESQLGIVKSMQRKFESSLFDIKQLLQADLFDSEIQVSKELNNKGFFRAAGAIAGVILEGHLSQVCINHSIKFNKKNSSINNYNQLLKDNDVIETKDWRFIQRLGDLRNLCDHKKDHDPTEDEVQELIDGIDKVTKTIF